MLYGYHVTMFQNIVKLLKDDIRNGELYNWTRCSNFVITNFWCTFQAPARLLIKGLLSADNITKK